MSRLESKSVAGYYALPPHLAPRVARLVTFLGGDAYGQTNTVFDPCAGDGAALLAMIETWAPAATSFRRFCRVGIEMEQSRARILATRFYRREKGRADLPNVALHADAFTVETRGSCNLLYLNPPYDTDPEHGRSEQKFLDRFTSALTPGGALLFVVPCSAVKASARYLATWYADVRCWRFPADDFAAYRQLVITGRKLGAPLPNAPGAAVIESWGLYPMRCPELLETPIADPLRIPRGKFVLALQKVGFDRTELLANLRPWEGLPVGVDLNVGTLQALHFPTALSTKPAHLALAIAAGHVNGFRLDPEPEIGGPAILLKGMFRKETRTLSEDNDEFGDVARVVTVEQPALTMRAFRLDTRTFWAVGEPAADGDDLERCSTIELMGRYSGSLANLMARQFPPLHDSNDPEQGMILPDLPRSPFTAQRGAINAALKLLAGGQNPKAIAEVGTGKTTIALYVYAALTPRWHAQTCRELARVGIDPSRLPMVRRALVLCPPHLLDTWQEEILGDGRKPGCIPWARVQVVRVIEDLRAEADIYLLSRETAKLGHGYKGVDAKAGRRHSALTGAKSNVNPSGGCPRCGRSLPDLPAQEIASKRLRCGYPRRSPGNAWARIAEGLAEIFLPVIPESGIARTLVANRRILNLWAAEEKPRNRIDRERVIAWLGIEGSYGKDLPQLSELSAYPAGSVFAELLAHLSIAGKSWTDWNKPVEIFRELAFALNLREEVGHAFHALAERVETQGKRNASEAGHELLCANPPAAWRDPTSDRRREALRQVLESLWALAEWNDRPRLARDLQSPEGSRRRKRADHVDPDELPPIELCGEPLYQASPTPRRYPLALFICRRMKKLFDPKTTLLIADEVHEYSNEGTAQSLAAHRLCGLGMPVLALTGSIMSGYASSLELNFRALDRSGDFRREFPFGSGGKFVEKYGLRKLIYTPRKGKSGESYGSQTDRRNWSCRVAGEAPGVVPLFILRHVLPAGVVVHKDELDAELPPLVERQQPLPCGETIDDQELMVEFERLTIELMDQIADDMFTPLSGKLWGAMMELPSYLDRCTADQGKFELRYPEGVNDGALVCAGRMWQANYRTPKERALLAYLRQEIAAGRRAIVFIRHVNSGLPQRLLRLIKEEGVTERAVYLNASKVSAQKRKAFISREIVDKEVDVLIVNPNSVKTGLNNMVWFASAWWHETDYSAQTFRQANGRIHRIGQEMPVEIVVPLYPGTAQEIAVDLVARKVTASLQVDALGVQGALEASGSGEATREALEATLAMGRAIYERLVRRRENS